MNRRSLLLAGVAATALRSVSLSQSASEPRFWFELRFFHLRNDLDRSQLDALFEESYLPMAKRIGLGPVGFFNVSMGPDIPTLVTLTSYPSLAVMESALEKQSRDTAWNKALDELDQAKLISYLRIESRLLHGFRTMPRIEVPSQEPNRAPRLFELRIYEAKSMRASETKIKMFDEGEISIFRQTGLMPVFFGQTVIGTGLPSLTYMLAYDSVEAREENWRKFLSHPDWIKLRSKPEYADSEIVSSIHSSLLRPTSYSPIR